MLPAECSRCLQMIGGLLVDHGHMVANGKPKPFVDSGDVNLVTLFLTCTSDRLFRFTADFENTSDNFSSQFLLDEWDISDPQLVLSQIRSVLLLREEDARVRRFNRLLSQFDMLD